MSDPEAVDGQSWHEPGRAIAAAAPATTLAADPAMLAAQPQIEIERMVAAADIDTRRSKATADMAIAAFRAQQWAEIERAKVGLKSALEAGEGRDVSRPV